MILALRLDVLGGLLKATYERYYAREAGLEVGESQSLLTAIKTLETAYEEQAQRLYEQQTSSTTEALKGMN